MIPVSFLLSVQLAIFIPAINGQAKYTVFTNTSSWIESSKTCSLATPSLHVSADGNYTIGFDTDITLAKEQSYWIGYQRSFRMFKYEGCSFLSPGLTFDFLLKPIPGLCFTACSVMMKSTYYGLRRISYGDSEQAECYCLTEKPTELLGTGCIRNCIYQPLAYPLVLCGGLQHVSVYSLIDDDYNSTRVQDNPNVQLNGNCVTYENVDTHSHKWYWTGCTRSLNPLCERPPTQANEKRTLVVYNEEYENWVEAAKHCLNTMMFPSTISYGEKDHYDKNALKISPPSWTAFFRDQFLFIPNGEMPSPVTECALITIGEDDQPKLSFRACLDNEKFNFICQEGTEQTTTTSGSKQTSSAIDPTLTGTMSTRDPLVTDRIKQDDEGISLVVPIVVGVVCGILVIIAIVVVIVCIKKRSKRKHQEAETKSIPELEHYTHYINNMDYAAVHKFGNGEAHHYANGRAHNGTIERNPKDDELDVDFTTESPTVRVRAWKNEGDDFYDHTDSSRKAPSPKITDNVYNTLNAKNGDDMYDVSDSNAKQNMQADGDLYNRLESQNQNMYDQTDASSIKKDNFVDPAYSRTKREDSDINSASDNQGTDSLYSRVNHREKQRKEN